MLSIWQEMDEEDGSGARQINMYLLLAIRRHYGSMCWLNNGYCLAVPLSVFDQIRTVGLATPSHGPFCLHSSGRQFDFLLGIRMSKRGHLQPRDAVTSRSRSRFLINQLHGRKAQDEAPKINNPSKITFRVLSLGQHRNWG